MMDIYKSKHHLFQKTELSRFFFLLSFILIQHTEQNLEYHVVLESKVDSFCKKILFIKTIILPYDPRVGDVIVFVFVIVVIV